jgi:predicted nucleic acid-binding Zn ribbon protein
MYIGNDKANAYNWINEYGEIIQRTPPFQRASNHPGLGFSFYEKYKSDMYPHDHCIVDGKERPIPKAYDRKFRKENPEEYARIKRIRNEKFTKHLNEQPYLKTKTFRKATQTILEQNLNLNQRNQT